jgi:hypothetical protein
VSGDTTGRYPQPQLAPNGQEYTLALSWGSEHWGGGRPRPCRSCGGWALLVDDQGRPQHKVCAEAEAESELEPEPEPGAEAGS